MRPDPASQDGPLSGKSPAWVRWVLAPAHPWHGEASRQLGATRVVARWAHHGLCL